MFANTPTEDNHSSFPRLSRQFVQVANILHDIQDETWRPEGVEINHIADRPVCESWAKDGDFILDDEVKS